MARVVWSVREGKAGTLNGPELMKGYRSTHPVQEPKLGDVLYPPDGSGPWRVVDWVLADHTNSAGPLRRDRFVSRAGAVAPPACHLSCPASQEAPAAAVRRS